METSRPSARVCVPRSRAVRHDLATLAIAAVLSLPSSAQGFEPLVCVGDPAPGTSTGSYVGFEATLMDDAGRWVVLTRVTGTADFALIDEGRLLLRRGSLVPTPLGQRIDDIERIDFDPEGRIGVLAQLDNGSTKVRSAVYRDQELVVQSGVPLSIAPFAGAAEVDFFFSVALAKSSLLATVRARLLGTVFESDILVRFELDSVGQPTSIDALAFPGKFLRGSPDPVAQITSRRSGPFTNAAGDALFLVELAGPSSENRALVLNDEVVAREGAAGPLPGFTYDFSSNLSAALNDVGNYAFVAVLSNGVAAPQVIVRDDSLVVAGGDSLPDVAPAKIANFGPKSVIRLTNAGDVVWFGGLTNTPVSQDEALFRNRELIVREGDLVAGQRVTGIPGSEVFDVSPDGRFLSTLLQLEGNLDCIGLFDLGAAVPVNGCLGNRATLERESGFVLAGSTFQLAMQGEQAPGAIPYVLVSTRLDPNAPCGTPLALGELLIDLGPGNPVQMLSGSVGETIPLAIPNDASLVDLTVFAQGFFVDQSGSSNEPIRATNAMRLVVGAP